MVLVGYELDKKCSGGGFFTFRQSWGTDYGDKGYARIKFDFIRQYGKEAFAIRLF